MKHHHALSKPCRVELYRLGKSVVRREARLNRSTRFQVESDRVESQAIVLQARKHMKKGWTILQALTISVELTSRVVFFEMALPSSLRVVFLSPKSSAALPDVENLNKTVSTVSTVSMTTLMT